jgi:hypothetical protein
MGDKFIWPRISPLAESKPADIIIRSGLNSLIIGNSKE